MAQITRPAHDPDKIIKEVHNTDNIAAKTELTSLQIEAVNKSKSLAKIFGSELLSSHIESFLVLQKSKDRRSMAEFVDMNRNRVDDRIEKTKNKLSFIG